MSALPHGYPRLLTGTPDVFATPQRGVALEDCWFYHTIDLPGHGTVAGPWDLREGLEACLRGVDYHGKRVLEFGTASGARAFGLRTRGGAVVTFDLAPRAQGDIAQ